jgi:excisionase family DNA binding protein
VEDLLTIDEAAALLRMSKKTFRRRMNQGEFAIVRDRRLVLVLRPSLVDYLRRHTVPSTRERAARRVTVELEPAPLPTARSRGRVRKLWETEA